MPAIAYAGPLEFTFTNPSFGGNPLNGSYIISKADKFRPKNSPTSEPRTQVDFFVEQLQRRVLSSLSSAVLADLSDPSGASEGSYVFDDFTLDYVRVDDEIQLRIDDGLRVVDIELPLYSLVLD